MEKDYTPLSASNKQLTMVVVEQLQGNAKEEFLSYREKNGRLKI